MYIEDTQLSWVLLFMYQADTLPTFIMYGTLLPGNRHYLLRTTVIFRRFIKQPNIVQIRGLEFDQTF